MGDGISDNIGFCSCGPDDDDLPPLKATVHADGKVHVSPTSADTLSGNYGVAKMILPDGVEVPCLARKVDRGDGTFGWVIIDDRVIAYEQREADTEFKASDHVAPNTEAVTKNPTTITVDDTTKKYISGDLIQFLGDPDRIIAQKGLDPERIAHMKAHPASLTMARRLCQVGGSKWQQVLQFLPKFYPETRP